MKVYELDIQMVDEAIINEGYAVCIEDGVIVDLIGGRTDSMIEAEPKADHEQHTLLPFPQRTEEDDQQDTEDFCTWLAQLPDTVLPAERKEEAIALARQEGLWGAISDIQYEMMLVSETYAEWDRTDTLREQFMAELNERAPAGVTFRCSDE